MTNSWKNGCQNELWGSLKGLFCNGKWIRTIFFGLYKFWRAQSLLDKKSKSELIVQTGRRLSIHATGLQEKHFTSSMYPRRGACKGSGYKKRRNGKKTKKRNVTIVQSVKSSFVKKFLKIFAPTVRSENYWQKLRYF